MWDRRKNIDQLTAATTLVDGDRIILAQGGSSEAKRGLLSSLYTYMQGKFGTVAAQNANAVNLTGGSMTGVAVHGLPAPSAGADAATKTYVDALALNVGGRGAVRLASTANVSIATGLANGQAIDGKTIVTGDVILLKNQTSPAENGPYVAPASGAAARAPQFDTWLELPGSLIAVEEGTANAETLWICTSDQVGTLGATAVTFIRIRIDIAVPVTPAQGGLGQDASAFTGILKFGAGVASVLGFDLDAALAANSDTVIPSQKAIKAYADSKGLKSKVIGSTYNLTTASGAQAITGVGFRPTSVIALFVLNGTFSWSVGFADSSLTADAIFPFDTTSSQTQGAVLGAIYSGSGGTARQSATITSFDADGMTLSWTKTGSPTGTANLYFLFLR